MKLFPPGERFGSSLVSAAAASENVVAVVAPAGMVDVLDDGSPCSTLKRGPERSVRRVKRAKNKAKRGRQETGSEVHHARGVERAPDKKLVHPGIGADIQQALSDKVNKWMIGVPALFWVAVSPTRMLVQLYRQCRLLVDHQGGGVKRGEVIKGLVRWLRSLPSLPELSPDVVYGFLIATGLDDVVDVYLDSLLRASPLELHFSMDFATEQPFDPRIHSEVNEKGLRTGDLCVVVFPTTMMWGGASELMKIVSKAFVLPKQAPEEVESLRQEIWREAILTGEVGLPPVPALLAMRKKGSLGKSIGPSATPIDALEAFQRRATDTAEGNKESATPVDSPTEDSGLLDLTPEEWESLLLPPDAGSPDEAAAPSTPAERDEEGDSHSKLARPGGDQEGVQPSETLSWPEDARLEELERWLLCYCSRRTKQ